MTLLQKEFSRINRDNTSGSAEILNNTLDALENSLQADPHLSTDELINELFKLIAKHNQFPVLFHFINYLLLCIDNKGHKGDLLLKSILQYRKRWNNVPELIARAFYREIPVDGKTVLIHSHSSTLVNLFKFLSRKKCGVKVIQTVSHPMEEGKIQARKIAELGFPVTLTEDSSVSLFLQQIDMFISGADMLTPEGFVNKTGTYFYALCCREKQVPVYVLADSRKLAGPNQIPGPLYRSLLRENEKAPGEIWKKPPQNIRISNHYFEQTPNDLVNAIIMETGTSGPFELKEKAKEIKVSQLLRKQFTG